MTRVINGKSRVLARNLPCPPVNVGVRSTPDYAALAGQAVHTIGSRKVFAGQRADAFHVDLGSVFDLGALRPFNEAHLISMPAMGGVNAVQSFNVHTIALQVPGPRADQGRASALWPCSTAGRRSVCGPPRAGGRAAIFDRKQGKYVGRGPWVQVSRLGNPLFNEVIVPMGREGPVEHAGNPTVTTGSRSSSTGPSWASCSPCSIRASFRTSTPTRSRGRTSTPSCSPASRPASSRGSQNFTGPVLADMLRLNMAVPPAEDPHPLGLVAGDAAGFPNGRRIGDDVVTIELRAIAGLTIPLVDPSFTPDGAAGAIEDGTSNTNAALLDEFPYLGLPGGGYQTQPGTTQAS